MGIKYFRPNGRGIKPQEIIKQNRKVDKQRASTISAENNLKQPPSSGIQTRTVVVVLSVLIQPDELLLISNDMTARRKLNIRKMQKAFSPFTQKQMINR